MQIKKLTQKYIIHLRTIGRSETGIKSIQWHLNTFAAFMKQSWHEEIESMTHETLSDYQETLAWQRTAKSGLLQKSTQAGMLGTIKRFCKWLVQEDYLISDPSKKLILPKQPKRLPRSILEEQEAVTLITMPDINTLQGYRDRLILELLYSTGIRRAECSAIQIEDVDYQEGYLRINSGKGDRDRVVPLGRIASQLCENYIKGIRPDLTGKKDDGYLIVNRWGKKMSPQGIYSIVKRYAKKSGLKKNIYTHTFRSSSATHMLRQGANIRHLQEMLGHRSITSTQIYTKVTITDLKKAHEKYHPREAKVTIKKNKKQKR